MELEAEIESLKKLNQDLQRKQVFFPTIFVFVLLLHIESSWLGSLTKVFSMLQAEIMKTQNSEVKSFSLYLFGDTFLFILYFM